MGIVFAILAFGFMIMIHEWGHYIAARKCGVRVLEFAFGMGPRILSRKSKKTGTIYAWRLFPIGGFCQMLGEEGADTQGGECDEEASYAPEESFSNKKVWQRFLIVAAGPFMNILAAFLIGFFLNMGFGYSTPVVHSVEPTYQAAQSGMEAGDTLLKVGKRSIHIMADINYALLDLSADPVEVVVRKADGSRQTLTVVPGYDEEMASYRLGITIGSHHSGLIEEMQEKGFAALFSVIGASISQSFWGMIGDIEMIFKSLAMLFTGKAGVGDMMGPIGIVSVMDDVYTTSAQSGFIYGLGSLLNLVVLLSVNLGVMNLFPIPALDGSRLVFLALEGIRRKPVSSRIENMVYIIGFVLLIGLMIFVAWQDISRIFFAH